VDVAGTAGDAEPDWRAAIERLEGAYAPSTLRCYHNDFTVFAKWCAERGIQPLPASITLICGFLADQTATSSPATLKRRLAGIRKIHRLLRMPDPTDDEDVVIALRRAKRARPCRPAQALGLTRQRRDALIAACGEGLIGHRNRALVAVGYDTLCRRSELVALRLEDLEPRPRGGFSVLVRRAKNDPFGMGRTAWISRAGAEFLKAWLEMAEIEEGPMFRPVYRGVPTRRYMNGGTVTRVLKDLAVRAGLPGPQSEQISGHSLRIGAAQDLMSDGRDLLTIMRAGGWKSTNVVSRYVEQADWRIWD
jgi:integrase/recombinase XerD